MTAPRVVIAVSPGVRPRLRAILAGCELHFVETGAEFQRALGGERCDLLIVGVHFDESTSVAALARVPRRADACPVVFVRGRRTSYGERSLHALRVALDALGAREFIDLVHYPDDALGNARVRDLLERLMPFPCS